MFEAGHAPAAAAAALRGDAQHAALGVLSSARRQQQEPVQSQVCCPSGWHTPSPPLLPPPTSAIQRLRSARGGSDGHGLSMGAFTPHQLGTHCCYCCAKPSRLPHAHSVNKSVHTPLCVVAHRLEVPARPAAAEVSRCLRVAVHWCHVTSHGVWTKQPHSPATAAGDPVHSASAQHWPGIRQARNRAECRRSERLTCRGWRAPASAGLRC